MSDNSPSPARGPMHDALAVFLGEWRAQGTSYGYTDQSGPDPRANGVPWTSHHTGRWHTGQYFLIQDERARPGGEVFDTLSIMGVDPDTSAYFARCFENHGYYRHYVVTRDGVTWQLSGEHERASITFSDNDRTQTIVWEWRPQGKWLPLCERIATREDLG
jgi:hypothetical protein